MRIAVDINTVNGAVTENKYELLEWLFAQNCPCDASAFLHARNIKMLEFLRNHNIPLNTLRFSDTLKSFNKNMDLLEWFANNKCELSRESIDTAIELENFELCEWLLKKGVQLYSGNWKMAMLRKNFHILEWLKLNRCPYDSSVTDDAFMHKDPEMIKWFIKNEFF